MHVSVIVQQDRGSESRERQLICWSAQLNQSWSLKFSFKDYMKEKYKNQISSLNYPTCVQIVKYTIKLVRQKHITQTKRAEKSPKKKLKVWCLEH